jgi:DNA-directed RNA polymerase subunit RPC12/RpoP
MTDKIKPEAVCPYCGEAGHLTLCDFDTDDVPDGSAVLCDGCGFQIAGAAEAKVLQLLVALMDRADRVAAMVGG